MKTIESLNCTKFFVHEVLPFIKNKKIDRSSFLFLITPRDMFEIFELKQNGTINKQGAFEVMEMMYQERLNNLVITMLAIGEKDD